MASKSGARMQVFEVQRCKAPIAISSGISLHLISHSFPVIPRHEIQCFSLLDAVHKHEAPRGIFLISCRMPYKQTKTYLRTAKDRSKPWFPLACSWASPRGNTPKQMCREGWRNVRLQNDSPAYGQIRIARCSCVHFPNVPYLLKSQITSVVSYLILIIIILIIAYDTSCSRACVISYSYHNFISCRMRLFLFLFFFLNFWGVSFSFPSEVAA